MRCPEPEAWIGFYGGETEESLAHRMAAHLQECARCREEFDRLSRLGAGIRGALPEPGRPRARRRRPLRASRPSWVPLAAAAALALAAVGLAFFREKPRAPSEPSIAQVPVVVVEEPRRAEEPPPAPEIPKPVFVAPPPPVIPEVRPPEPLPPPVEPPPEEPAASRPGETIVAVALLDRVEGDVAVSGAPARAAQDILPGQEIATGPRSRAVVKFPDGTRMELGEQSSIGRISDRAGAQGIGKWIDMTRGTLEVQAAKQAKDRAMAIATPDGEARIVGTTFRLAVAPGSTRLEVAEGKVRLTRPGAPGVDVIGSHYAVAAAGVELAARPLPKAIAETLFRFDFEDGRLPKPFDGGAVGKGPDARSCLAGPRAMLREEPNRGLFAYADDLVLSFDYWADATVRTLDFHAWNRTRQVTFGSTAWEVPCERWTHVVLPLSELLRTEGDRSFPMTPGDQVATFWIQPGQPGAALHIDNLELVRLRSQPKGAKR